MIFASSAPAESRRLRLSLGRGELRQVAPRIYTSNLGDDPAVIVRRNLFVIAAHRFPGAVISHRSALKPESVFAEGRIYLTSPGAAQTVEYPGAVIQHSRGSGPVTGDQPFLQGGLYLSSTTRALLENCQRSRRGGDGSSKTISDEEMEVWLERLQQFKGAAELNRLRDDAALLASLLGMEDERVKLNSLIATTLGTGEAAKHSVLGRARARGLPYDAGRIAAFQGAAAFLSATPLPEVLDPLCALPPEAPGRVHRAFYDAYFSNFIEGTEFEVEEAERIVFAGHRPARRPKDAHDISASFALARDQAPLPETTAQWIEALRAWHHTLMDGRDEVSPGLFKDRSNRVGTRQFVAPDLVEGTLHQAFEMGATLREPFARACFWKLVVTEVHPFNDGNGRISRIVLNRLLARERLVPVIVPNVFREDYVTSLAAFTNTGRIEPLVMALHKAQQFTAAMDFDTLDGARSEMTARNAFASPNEAKLDWRPSPPNDVPLPSASPSHGKGLNA